MANEEVAERTEESELLLEQTQLPRTLMGGTRAMKEAAHIYLPPEPKESAQVYAQRLRRTFLFNMYRSSVHNLSGRPFANPLKLTEDTPAEVLEWAKDIDLNGRSLHLFARDLLNDGIIAGRSHILIDTPRFRDPVVTLAEERERNVRPYWQHVPPEAVLGWRSETFGSTPRLTQVRVAQRVVRPAGRWGEQWFNQVLVLEPGGFELWEQDLDDEDDWKMLDAGETSFDEIPFLTFYASWDGFMSSQPPLEDLAFTNLAHFQSMSDQRHILHVARVPLLFGAGFPEAAEGTSQIEISVNRAVLAGDPAAKLGYIEHSGAAIGAGRQDLKDLEEQMVALSLDPLIARVGNMTATQSALGAAESHSTLQAMAYSLRNTLNEALLITERAAGIEEGGEVQINTEFGLQLREAEHVGALLQMRLAGDISRETFWAELKRRDVLSDLFDPDTEIELLDEEAPSMEMMGIQQVNAEDDAVIAEQEVEEEA